MNKYFIGLTLSIVTLIFLIKQIPPIAQAQPSSLWIDVTETTIARTGQKRLIVPAQYRLVQVDRVSLMELLGNAPQKRTVTRQSSLTLTLPLPDGTMGQFYVEAVPLLAPALAERFPDIKTYHGWGISDPTATIRLDITPAGFHGLILSSQGTVYIDPYRQNDTEHYISYYRHDYQATNHSFRQFAPVVDTPRTPRGANRATSNGTVWRTYRLAVAATGEYTQFHGGTVSDGMSAIVTTINRVTGIYNRELAVDFELVENNEKIVYTDSDNDPYTNDDGYPMMSENQETLDELIGTSNYDVGHVFSTGGGGIASVRSACQTGSKAKGVTGQDEPINDPFDVDYVSHEIGHQFGGEHTYNAVGVANCTTRTANKAYEPASGSTIMGYTGTCTDETYSQDLQPNSDPYFHTASFEDMVDFLNDPYGGDACDMESDSDNKIPTVSAGFDQTIPANTQFALTGSGSDADGDTLTYSWEQFDRGSAWTNKAVLPNTDLGSGPIFRSMIPMTSPTRIFPNRFNPRSAKGESLPTTNRALNFRLTVRDNRGGVSFDGVTLNVITMSEPFTITEVAPIWTQQSEQSIAWNIAETNDSPINCDKVDIFLSTDGGRTFSINLASELPNNGLTTITVPSDDAVNTTKGRVKVACHNNIFFTVSSNDITVVETMPTATPTATPQPTATPLPTNTPPPGQPISINVSSDTETILNSNDAEQRVTVRFPVGVVSSNQETTATFNWQTHNPTTHPLKNKIGLERFFELTVSPSVPQFNLPITITVKIPANAINPALYYWDDSTWSREGIVTVARTNTELTSTTDHFSLFAVLDEHRVYLPLVVKN
ncbi:zinc-dependent metalloprotease family protein [Anaerolineales bacterium HSG25]|nr:zinc-dependent metalloprotease family protein [Anaerolineales bacterium HSG25]